MTPQEIKDQINEKENLIEIKKGAWEKGSNEVVDYYIWNGPETGNFNPVLTFVRGETIPPEPKTLDEARGEVGEDLLEDALLEPLAQRAGVGRALLHQPVEERQRAQLTGRGPRLGREGLRWAIEDMTEVRLLVIRTP